MTEGASRSERSSRSAARADLASSGEWRGALLCCAGLSLAIAGFYLALYPLRHFDQPLGYDTAQYLWRARCVSQGGMEALGRCAPQAFQALPSRAGFPLVALTLSSMSSTSLFTVAAMLPAVTAATIGLGAAALVTSDIEARLGEFALIAAVVGFSPMVVQMAGPEYYADAMLAMTVGLAALVAVVYLTRRGHGLAAAAALLAVTALIHWPTAAILVAALLGVVLVTLPDARSSRRGGVSLAETVSGRILAVLAVAITGWAVALAVLVRAVPDRFYGSPQEFAAKVRAQLPRYGFPISVPAAALGWVCLGAREKATRPAERRVLSVLFGAWLAVLLALLVAWILGLRSFPAHRLFILALPIPMLGAVALLWAGERVGRRFPRSSVVAVACGVLVVTAAGFFLWAHNRPTIRGDRRAEAAVIAEYLTSQVPAGVPAIEVGDVAGAPLNDFDVMQDTMRTTLPVDRIADTWFYLGTPQRLLAGEPTLTSDPAYNEVSMAQWALVQPLLARPHVILVSRSYSPAFEEIARAMPDRVIAGDLVVLEGPLPPDRLTPASPEPLPGAGRLVALALASVLALGTIGVGWTVVGLPDLRPLERFAVAPAVGMAAVVVAAFAADRAGLRLQGSNGTLVAVAVALAGWAAAYLSTVRRRRLPTRIP
ncbi:MAG: hypothetical protein HY240_04845 [Actinobacteria bacterium]|nr:hypothetical protein [Actinomycetota bacterium]